MNKIFGVVMILGMVFSSLGYADRGVSYRRIESLKEGIGIPVDKIARVDELGKNEGKNKTVRLIFEYLGGSTDVSNQYQLYVSYNHAGEESDLSTAFKLDSIYQLHSVTLVQPGVYKLHVTTGYEFEEYWTIDTTQVWIDDEKIPMKPLESAYFESSIVVKNERLNSK